MDVCLRSSPVALPLRASKSRTTTYTQPTPHEPTSNIMSTPHQPPNTPLIIMFRPYHPLTNRFKEIKVNWAYQNNNMAREDTSNHFHIFVGDLSNDVNDEVLLQAFSVFGTVSEARVMWDMKTGRSRGYGFVAFRDQGEAGKAISSMDGEWLGSRAIRCNWANQKGQPSISQQSAMAAMGIAPAPPFQAHHQFPTSTLR